MQHKTLAAGLLAAFAAVARAESDVTQLTQDTFDDFVKANDLVLAECKLRSRCPSLSSCYRKLTLVALSSLRPLVRSLQGPRPRVRGGCYFSEGEGHQARQDRLHRGGRSLQDLRC